MRQPRSARPPGFIAPMEPTLVDAAPDGDAWLHEIKYDGYRTELVIQDGAARAYTRRGHDWTDRYAPVVAAAKGLPCLSAVLDGEMIVQDPQGRSDYHALRRAIHRAPHRLVFYGFDLLTLNGEDFRARPLIERRVALEQLVGRDPASPIHHTSHFVGNGSALFAAADKSGLEGIVSKQAGSRYASGRTTAWVKAKCFTVETMDVVGSRSRTTAYPTPSWRTPPVRTSAKRSSRCPRPSERRSGTWSACWRLPAPGLRRS